MAFFQDKTTYVKKRYFYLTEIKVNLAKFDFYVTVLFLTELYGNPKVLSVLCKIFLIWCKILLV